MCHAFPDSKPGGGDLRMANGETNVSLNAKESALKKECNEEQPPAVNEQPLTTQDLMMSSDTEIAFVHNDLCTVKVLADRIFVPTSTPLSVKELHSKGYKIDRILPGSKGWLILLRYDGESKTEIEIAVIREKNWDSDYLSIKALLKFKGYKIDRIVPGSEGWLIMLTRGLTHS